MERPDRTRTASDGHYHFMDLPHGNYTLKASLPEFGTRYSKAIKGDKVEIIVGKGKMVKVDFAGPATALTGRIVAGNKQPIALAEVTILGTRERTFSDSNKQSKGTYLLSGLEKGSQTIKIFARSYEKKEITVELNQGILTRRDIELTPKSSRGN